MNAIPFPREQLAETLKFLAGKGIYLGTSSWKYPGWVGMLYSEERYQTRGKFSEAKFKRECLKEYATVFSSVCVDAGYYRFPSPKFLENLFVAVEEQPQFQFSFKVADEITVRRFPNLPRHSDRAGKLNPNFLHPELFVKGVLNPLEPYRDQVGTLIFEFTRLKRSDGLTGQDFLERLDHFFDQLPKGWKYAVEIRNESLFRSEYFEVLNRHQISHVFNQWTRMPEVQEQWTQFGGAQMADYLTFRMLLAKGMSYEQAVGAFSPYEKIQEIHGGVRKTIEDVVEGVIRGTQRKRQVFIYVNNRLEGNSLLTLAQVLEGMEWLGVKSNPQPKNPVQSDLFGTQVTDSA